MKNKIKKERTFGECLILTVSDVIKFETKRKRRQRYWSNIKKAFKIIFFIDK